MTEPEATRPLEELLQELQKITAQSAAIQDRKRSNTPQLLIELLGSYSNRERFEIGTLVTWKDGLKDRLHPSDREPAIVMEILETPILDSGTDVASPWFRERYDLVCGVLVEGKFLRFHFNSSRLRRY
jgi:hypothetical protein